ncbi:hypothetical protein AS142_13585 [Bacillus pumilus]|nr:hypothetical protein AS142_13585 [Bacillus pumilus]
MKQTESFAELRNGKDKKPGQIIEKLQQVGVLYDKTWRTNHFKNVGMKIETDGYFKRHATSGKWHSQY